MSGKETPAAPVADEENELPEAEEAETEETEEGAEGEETEETEDGEGEKAETKDGEDAEGEDSEEGEGKSLSKWGRKRAAIKARLASLEEIALRESERADREAAARKALTADLGPPPKREDFADPEEYAAELAAYRIESRTLARQTKTLDATSQEAQKRAWESKSNLFQERTMALAERYPNIREVVFSQASFPVPDRLADVFMESERGPEVAYYLATHPADMQRVFSMSPLSAAREVGRIEATITAPKPRTQTKAPPPVRTVGGGTTKAVKDPDKMTTDEWLEWRNAQLERPRKKAS